jgi:hypothetical protein
MSIYEHILDVEKNRDGLKRMTDDVLDLYKKNPKECEKILIEINSLNKEFDDIEKELEVLKDEIY